MKLVSQFIIQPSIEGQGLTLGQSLFCRKQKIKRASLLIAPSSKFQMLEVYELSDGLKFKIRNLKK